MHFEITSDYRLLWLAPDEKAWKELVLMGSFAAAAATAGCCDATVRGRTINRQCTRAQLEVKRRSTRK